MTRFAHRVSVGQPRGVALPLGTIPADKLAGAVLALLALAETAGYVVTVEPVERPEQPAALPSRSRTAPSNGRPS